MRVVVEVDAKKSDIPLSNFHRGSVENLFRMEQRNPFICDYDVKKTDMQNRGGL